MATIKQRATKFDNKPSTFAQILDRNSSSAGKAKSREADAVKWFQTEANKTKVKASELMRQDASRLKDRLAIGEMAFFFYDPKHKETLPYYDSFPLIIKIENYPDGRFLGLNFHYLPYVLRAKLMDALYGTISNKKYDDTTKLKITYDILKSAAKFAPFKPCIKMYLNSQVRSRFLKVHSYEWDIALFLPVQDFQKMNANKVWQQSRTKI